MYKQKTRKAVAKRFSVKPSGKIKYDPANHEHIATKKERSRKNRLKKGTYIETPDHGRIMRCLPYG